LFRRNPFLSGAGSERLKQISWEGWFEKFDDNKLTFLCQDKKAASEESTFFKLMSRENEQERGNERQRGN
jgi:hypothetical protein